MKKFGASTLVDTDFVVVPVRLSRNAKEGAMFVPPIAALHGVPPELRMPAGL